MNCLYVFINRCSTILQGAAGKFQPTGGPHNSEELAQGLHLYINVSRGRGECFNQNALIGKHNIYLLLFIKATVLVFVDLV
jgi:hypothetical protein